MKLRTAVLCLCGLAIMAAASAHAANATENKAPAMTTIHVQIGDKVFTARLEDNETARAFVAMLPLKLDMRDLNDNEKVIELSKKLPGGGIKILEVGN